MSQRTAKRWITEGDRHCLFFLFFPFHPVFLESCWCIIIIPQQSACIHVHAQIQTHLHTYARPLLLYENPKSPQSVFVFSGSSPSLLDKVTRFIKQADINKFETDMKMTKYAKIQRIRFLHVYHLHASWKEKCCRNGYTVWATIMFNIATWWGSECLRFRLHS